MRRRITTAGRTVKSANCRLDVQKPFSNGFMNVLNPLKTASLNRGHMSSKQKPVEHEIDAHHSDIKTQVPALHQKPGVTLRNNGIARQKVKGMKVLPLPKNEKMLGLDEGTQRPFPEPRPSFHWLRPMAARYFSSCFPLPKRSVTFSHRFATSSRAAFASNSPVRAFCT